MTICVKAGSAYETKKTNGLSHLVEHMFFKTNPFLSGADIGGLSTAGVIEIDAATGPESTLYTLRSLSACTKELVMIGYHAFKNKSYLADELEKEKNVALSELLTILESPGTFLGEGVFLPMAFKGTALEKDVAGTETTIAAFQENDVRELKSRFYTPNNMIITLAGDFNVESILNLIKKTFGALKRGKNVPSLKKEHLNQKKRTSFLTWPQLKQEYLCYGYQTSGVNSKDYPALMLLDMIIDGGPFPTKLSQRLREIAGIGYYQQSFFEPYSWLGALGIGVFGFNPRYHNQAMDIIHGIYQELAKKCVAKDEFKRAKDMLLDDIVAVTESPVLYAESLAEDALLGRCSIRRHISELKQTSREDIRRAAKKYFNDNFVLAVLGPEYNEFASKSRHEK